MLGKQKCKILKEIRQRIADENDIPYVTRECRFQGECKGTCPRCEAELRYLEQQLALRASLGKRVTVAALCAGMTFAAAGCAPFGGTDLGLFDKDITGMTECVEPSSTPMLEIEIETEEEPEETKPSLADIIGMLANADPSPETELTGDVYSPEEQTG